MSTIVTSPSPSATTLPPHLTYLLQKLPRSKSNIRLETLTELSQELYNSEELKKTLAREILLSLPFSTTPISLSLFRNCIQQIPPSELSEDEVLLKSVLAFLHRYDTVKDRKHWEEKFVHSTVEIFANFIKHDEKLMQALKNSLHREEEKNLGLLKSLLVQGYLQRGLLMKAYDLALDGEDKRLLHTTAELLLHHLSHHNKTTEASDVLHLITSGNYKIYPRTLTVFVQSLIRQGEDELLVKWKDYLIKKCFFSQDILIEMAEAIGRVHSKRHLPSSYDEQKHVEQDKMLMKEFHSKDDMDEASGMGGSYIRHVREIYGLALKRADLSAPVDKRYNRLMVEMKATARGFSRGFGHLSTKYNGHWSNEQLLVADFPNLTSTVRVSKDWTKIRAMLLKRTKVKESYEIITFYVNIVLHKCIETCKETNDFTLLEQVLKVIKSEEPLANFWNHESLRLVISGIQGSSISSGVINTLSDLLLSQNNKFVGVPVELKYLLMKSLIEDQSSWVHAFKMKKLLGYNFHSFPRGSQERDMELALKGLLRDKCKENGYLERVLQLS